MITDEVALLAKAGDSKAITQAFKAAEAYADHWGLQNVSLEFLNVLETWNPRKGPFWKRLLFRLHRSYEPHGGRRAKHVVVDLERLAVGDAPIKPTHAVDVRDEFREVLSGMSHTAQCLYKVLVATRNQFTQSLSTEDMLFTARKITSDHCGVEFSETITAWDEVQAAVTEYMTKLEAVA